MKRCATCTHWAGDDTKYIEMCRKVSARVPFDYVCSEYQARPNNQDAITQPGNRDYNNMRLGFYPTKEKW